MNHSRIFLLVLCICSSLLWAATPVKLQLKWEHEFQFAGYYAALWQGYYEDAGLSVEIISGARADGQLLVPTDRLRSGEVDFAIGSIEVFSQRQPGDDFVILAPIFQRSAIAFFSLPETELDDLADLAGSRIAMLKGGNTQAEVEALFLSQGYDVSKITFVDAPVTINSLLDGLADVIVTYQISAEYQAMEKGVVLNRLLPADYGVEFYGDSIYTTRRYLEQNPQVVSKFVDASLRGWHYALSHKREIAEKISREFPRYIYQYDDQLAYNYYFADSIEELTGYPVLTLGESNPGRWQTMLHQLIDVGVVEPNVTIDGMLYQPQSSNQQAINFLSQILLLIALLVLVFFFWYRRHLYATVASIAALALALTYQAERQIQRENEQVNRVSVLQKLNSISANLKGNLQTNLTMLRGFSAFISANPDLTEEQFNNYAREVFKKNTLINNFAAAKDMVVNYVYPLKGNEKALGLDYRKNLDQRDLALQVANTGQLLVVGPVELVQGGTAFIGRAPIYTGSGTERRLWGIISAPIDAEKLFRSSGIRDDYLDMEVAIRSFDSFGNLGKVFWGTTEVFEASDAELITLSVGGGSWQIAAKPKLVGDAFTTSLWTTRLIILVTALFIIYYVNIRFRQEREKIRLQSELLESQRLLEKVGRTAKVGGWKIDRHGTLLQWSLQSSRILKLPQMNEKTPTFESIRSRFEEESFKQLEGSIKYALEFQQSFDIDLKLIEDKHWVRVIGSPSTEDSELILTGTIQDVSDKVESSLLIEHQANYDSLTNLPNRALFNDRLVTAIEKASRQENKLAVLFIDLDRFKSINDNYGHDIGDKLLIAVAKNISECVRESDTVSRLSGDEFGVILGDVHEFHEALSVTEKILEKLETAYRINNSTMYTSASIGISIYPNDGVDAKTLLRKADQAMYEVKRSGRNGWQFYTLEMQQRSEYRHSLLMKLIKAVNEEHLESYFQPIYDLERMVIDKCEALARWQVSDGEYIPPSDFIPLAEESGLVNRIDLQIFNQAASFLKQQSDAGKDIGLSINISPRLFQTKDHALEQWLSSVLDYRKSIRITVEMTERLLTDDSIRAIKVLEDLRTKNIRIAIDDFGTGYSSLSYLVKFPVDVIKIDRSFVERIGQEKSAETLVKTIIAMAKKLDLKVIAEGIETEQQLQFLQQQGCQYGQGYYLAKPMNKHDFEKLLMNESLLS
ncbi:EAL domain-containing protein [Pleionea litopenaei]|uniref:EAL domain-containing protein n=1 Tax=Pleionea litopenaei TaxID=3070815 RepID=A0AA51RRL4_9GAMM|nr:EAL domain-containing protein [Pleionea sp. HL-JVS1]WMS86346.1 EAL domain-containing protein [Pleionea sp. HL-JVS1]